MACSRMVCHPTAGVYLQVVVSLLWGVLDCHGLVGGGGHLISSSCVALPYVSPEDEHERTTGMMLLSMKGICVVVGENGHFVPVLYCGICCAASSLDHAAVWSLAQMTTCISIKQ